MRPPDPTPRSAAIRSAAVVLLFGFITLSLLSATGRWHVGRSMWHYRSATWGDAVVLPTIVAVLAAAVSDRRLPRAPNERAWATAGALLFGIAGLLVQISWIAASDPVRNWTIPRPHHFSLPGWYHAVFLITTAAVTGVMTLLTAHRIRAAPPAVRDTLSRAWTAAALCGAAIAFGVLLALDSADSVDTSAGQGSATAAITSVLALIALASWVLGPRAAIRPIARGLLIAVALLGVATLTYGWPG